MGTFTQRITLHGPTSSETLEALVDSGAMFTVVPAPILQRLGVRPFRSMRVRFASGQVQDWPLGQVETKLDGQRMPILCLFGAQDAPPLLGAHALEAFLLMVDPVEQKLVPKEAFLMAVDARPGAFQLVSDFHMTGDQPNLNLSSTML